VPDVIDSPRRSASAQDAVVTFRSMASPVRFWATGARRDDIDARMAAARAVVERVAETCTRFDDDSDLMRANAAGRRWTVVARECYDALHMAHRAHQLTDGRFDPRVLRALHTLGYDRALPFADGPVHVPGVETPRAGRAARRRRPRWAPRFDEARSAVRIGPEPVDLGGIGKGLAVRWAADRLRGSADSVLVEAGGDLLALGAGPDGEGWMVSVEDPYGGEQPVAVLRLRDRACATSSIRLRTWDAGGRQVHHLIEPATGEPAQSGLRSVTVVGADPAMAEVWSKVAFLCGRDGIRAAVEERHLAALWVGDDRRVAVSTAMRPFVAWQVSRVP
jgi:thiamine biosynthesis lipoprotein